MEPACLTSVECPRARTGALRCIAAGLEHNQAAPAVGCSAAPRGDVTRVKDGASGQRYEIELLAKETTPMGHVRTEAVPLSLGARQRQFENGAPKSNPRDRHRLSRQLTHYMLTRAACLRAGRVGSRLQQRPPRLCGENACGTFSAEASAICRHMGHRASLRAADNNMQRCGAERLAEVWWKSSMRCGRGLCRAASSTVLEMRALSTACLPRAQCTFTRKRCTHEHIGAVCASCMAHAGRAIGCAVARARLPAVHMPARCKRHPADRLVSTQVTLSS